MEFIIKLIKIFIIYYKFFYINRPNILYCFDLLSLKKAKD